MSLPPPDVLHFHWNRTREGQRQLMHIQLHEALANFRYATNMNWASLYVSHISEDGRPLYRISDDPDAAGLNWLTVYYGDYYRLARQWRDWFIMIDNVRQHPDYDRLPDGCKSRLISAWGWAVALHNKSAARMKDLIAEQQTALDSLHLTDFEQALHHLAISQACRYIRQSDQGFTHIQRAIDLISLDESPFYALLSRESLGDLYYVMHLTHEGYGDKAEQIYSETESLARELGSGIDVTMNGYNLGWLYAEREDYHQALAHFRRGEDDAQHLTEYERSLIKYGMGYVYHCLGEEEWALDCLYAAVEYFQDQTLVMTAACLNLIAGIVENEDTQHALERATDALDAIRQTDNPVQRHHITLRLARLSQQQGFYRAAIRYAVEARDIRRMTGMKR